MNRTFPFAAIVGQELMKRALVLNAIDPGIGGVLIRGEKGTGKSTIVRSVSELLPGDITVIDLPLSATEDRVVGTLDIEHALKSGEKRFEPGLLARAHGNILYVDEVNLLEDHIVDLLLDVAAMGVNSIEREGISFSHPSRFILVGTMNPEEGELRPQLLDRFGVVVDVTGEQDPQLRTEVMRRRLGFEADPASFCALYDAEQSKICKAIESGRSLLPAVRVSDELLEKVARITIAYEVDGHRADIVTVKVARAMAAYEKRVEMIEEDLLHAAQIVLPHRMRKQPFEHQRFEDLTLRSFF